MFVLPIKALPNQQLSIILDSNQWSITIRDVIGSIAVSLSKNTEVIVQNARAVSGMRILQAKYQEDGNFAIISNDQSVPDYTQFGVTQFLVYISPAELEVSLAPDDIRIDADFFDPLGGLPLRFAPQGYTVAGIRRERGVQFKAKATLAAKKGP